MANLILRFEGTLEVECSNAAAKAWEKDGEVTAAAEKLMNKVKSELETALDKTEYSVYLEDMDVEDSTTDD